MDNRRFDRTGLRKEAVVRHNGAVFRGELENLSLKGLFIRTEQKIAIHDRVEVTICFASQDSRFCFTIPARVVRANDEGIGLSYKKIDFDSLMHSGSVLENAWRDQDGQVEDIYHFLDSRTSPSTVIQ